MCGRVRSMIHFISLFLFSIQLNDEQAKHARDTLIKTVYTALFEWIVQQINRKLHSDDLESTNNFIGILDMPGFGKY